MTEQEHKKLICEIGRRLYERGLISGADGNISIRLRPGRFLATPAGCSKGFLKPEDIAVTDAAGRPLGPGHPSSEMQMHLAVYRKRSDVGAVVHAHPPTAVAMTFAGVSLEQCIMPEVLIYMGTVPTARYATPSSPECPQAVENLIERHDALLLDRHGALTVGEDLLAAWERMEKLENLADVVFKARSLGAVRTLSADELERLEKMAASIGRKVDASMWREASPPYRQDLIDKLAAQVARLLRESGLAEPESMQDHESQEHQQ